MTHISGYFPDLALGVSGLLAHKLRSLLAMLGLILGSGTIVTLLAARGAGVAPRMTSALGPDSILVEARAAGGLSMRDARAISEQIPNLAALAPARTLLPARLFPKPVRQAPTLAGASPNVRFVFSLALADGRFFNEEDDRGAAPVCVLGEAAKLSLLGYGPAVGKYIKADDVWLRVIGVLAGEPPVAGELGSFQLANRNALVLVPLTTLSRRFTAPESVDAIDVIALRVAAGSDPGLAATAVNAILARAHPGPGDFRIAAPGGLLETQRRRRIPFLEVAMAIAILSLLMGGLGVMNIMLAAVIERTREIGVRRAIGARRTDIARQFVSESAVIAALSALIGIALGELLSRAVAAATGWPAETNWKCATIALAVTVGSGVAFGLYPARQAAMLRPADAIREK